MLMAAGLEIFGGTRLSPRQVILAMLGSALANSAISISSPGLSCWANRSDGRAARTRSETWVEHGLYIPVSAEQERMHS